MIVLNKSENTAYVIYLVIAMALFVTDIVTSLLLHKDSNLYPVGIFFYFLATQVRVKALERRLHGVVK